jgi:hypothetical protein
MPIIKIQPESIRQNSNRISQTANDLTSLHWEINRLANQLDWEVRCRGGVESKISHAASMGKSLAQEAQRLSEYLKSCANAFEDADSKGQQSIAATASSAVKSGIGTGAMLGASIGGSGVLAGLIASKNNASAPYTKLTWLQQLVHKGDAKETEQLATLFSKFKTMNSTFINKYHIGTAYAGEYAKYQCRGFVRQYYKDVLSIDDTMLTGSHQYELVFNNSSISQVGQIVNTGTVNAQAVQDLFRKATAGDIVQMNGSTGLHSAIFGGVSGNGEILFYDANFVPADGIPNLIQFRVKTVNEFASYISCANGGVTVYTAGK